MIVIDRYTTEYSYNGIGRNATLTTWQDADTPQITAWSCNHRGQMTAETNADNHPVTCSYDGDGQQLPHPWARQVNGAPLITTCSYDAAGRQTGYSDGVPPAVILTLNFLDRQTSVTDAAGTRNFTYDAAHRLANEKNPLIVNGLLSHTYAPTVRTATIGNGTDTRTDAYMPETWDIASSSRQTADPLGYPDGWNNFAYVNNGVTMNIDWLGGCVLGIPIDCGNVVKRETYVRSSFAETLLDHTFACGGSQTTVLEEGKTFSGSLDFPITWQGTGIDVSVSYSYTTSQKTTYENPFTKHSPLDPHISKGSHQVIVELFVTATIEIVEYECGRIEENILEMHTATKERTISHDCVLE